MKISSLELAKLIEVEHYKILKRIRLVGKRTGQIPEDATYFSNNKLKRYKMYYLGIEFAKDVINSYKISKGTKNLRDVGRFKKIQEWLRNN